MISSSFWDSNIHSFVSKNTSPELQGGWKQNKVVQGWSLKPMRLYLVMFSLRGFRGCFHKTRLYETNFSGCLLLPSEPVKTGKQRSHDDDDVTGCQAQLIRALSIMCLCGHAFPSGWGGLNRSTRAFMGGAVFRCDATHHYELWPAATKQLQTVQNWHKYAQFSSWSCTSSLFF